jgi:ribosomal protein S18 acetylase RimI-like enzyme
MFGGRPKEMWGLTQPSGVVVRPATANDAQAIGSVFDAAVQAGWSYLGDVAQEPMFDQSDWDQLVVDHVPPSVLLVAVNDAGRVVGFAAAHPADGELFLLFVDPGAARRGIGRTLLSAAHDALRAAGCQRAHLYTHENDERALAVYTSAGYRPDGTTRESNFREVHIRELRLETQL